MKPIVIYIDKNASKISLTKEEFEKHLKEAYDAGYNTGYNKGREYNCYRNWWNSPTITTTTPYYNTGTGTGQEIKPNKYWEVTCEASNTVGD